MEASGDKTDQPVVPLGTNDLSSTIVDVADAVIVVLDRDGRIVRWNRAAAALTGLTVNETIGRVFSDVLLLPTDVERWKRDVEQTLKGSPPVRAQYRWKASDGSSRPVSCSKAVLRNPGGEAEYWVVTAVETQGGISARAILDERAAERRDLSRFLHDTIAQELVVLSFMISKLQAAALDAPAADETRAALDLANDCCRSVRVVNFMLSPVVTDETDLVTAIDEYASYLREEAGLLIDCYNDPVSGEISPEARFLFLSAIHLWVERAIQRHRGTKLVIRLRNSSLGLILELELDNGGGTGSGGASGTPAIEGWAAIQESVRVLGGVFESTGGPALDFVRILLPESEVSKPTLP
jgi:PAS domain S-box-containing protein